MSPLQRHLVVTGMPGTGKSNVTPRLAEHFGVDLRDSDDDIERLFGETGKQIAEHAGVTELHRLEAAVLLGTLAAPDPMVIAAAGSVIDDGRCRAALERTASLFVLTNGGAVSEVAGNGHRRPIGRDEVAELVTRRMPLWRAHAVEVISNDRSVDDIVERIVRHV